MINHSIINGPPLSSLMLVRRLWQQRQWRRYPIPRLCCPTEQLPLFVRRCPLTMQVQPWLSLMAWSALPEAKRGRPKQDSVPLAAYLGAFLVKLDQQLPTLAALHRFLVAHPALVWGLGFPLHPADSPLGFDVLASLPTRQHFGRRLRQLPNDWLQRLLDAQVTQLQAWLPHTFGQTISMDTKAILAWVKENNPKEYVKEGRFDKSHQPAGDPDCKVGCKRRHKRLPAPLAITPTREGHSAAGLPVSVGEFYWGYASGIVVTKVPDWGEFVLAELTQTFDKGETTYFFPLMAQTERRLGFRPQYGALDKGFDAFYVYDHFHNPGHDGFAAIPFTEKGTNSRRQFDAAGLPLCAAGLAMPLKFTYMDRTTAIIPYRRARHVCPLLFPQPDGRICPIDHKNWPQGGCATSLADTPGARIRHQLDRQSDTYHLVYNQRTASERIFSLAIDLGIERPKLRNQAAIANLNTLTYLLINLRAMRRVLAQRTESTI